MTVLDVERICPKCGAVVTARDTLSALDAFVLHVAEVVWCPKCGTELSPPHSESS